MTRALLIALTVATGLAVLYRLYLGLTWTPDGWRPGDPTLDAPQLRQMRAERDVRRQSWR